MLPQTQLNEIKEKLEASQNPLFFFDNDADGLCAFLILRRAIDRGKGIAIKSFPDLKEQYVKKVEELNPDAIFILDKAELSKEFAEQVEQKNIPITWIDHHETKTPKQTIEKTSYYNSLPSAEPTTYITQKIFNRQEDLWLATIGCISDVYIPDFAKKFAEQNPELLNPNLEPLDILHSTEIGKIVRMLNFGLMDTTTNVIALIKYLFKAKNTYDLLEENRHTKQLHKRYTQLNEFLNKQIAKAEANIDPKSPTIFFSYAGNTSMSSEIANKLYFKHKDKLIIVAFKRPEKINISIRGENALKITYKAIANIEEATGGGHEKATGAMIPVDSLDKFKQNIIKILNQ
jgi:oligoribonuclease NrnB/cAMP/cGMP phosphodiesterase (DHH superfamily)